MNRMANIERSDLSEDQWRWSEPERVSPDDPIVHGARWRRERDEARQQLKGAVRAERERIITRLVEMADALDPDAVARTAETLRRAAAVLDVEGGQ